MIEENTFIEKISNEAIQGLQSEEIRLVVDNYYRMQHHRLRLEAQMRALSPSFKEQLKMMEKNPELKECPPLALTLLSKTSHVFKREEKFTANILSRWVKSHPRAKILCEAVGVGHILAAGLVAHVNWSMVCTAGKLWSFCGLNPESEWKKGEKRPWNAHLKQLCFLIGESFVKQKNRENDVYGKIYQKRKDWENARNEALTASYPEARPLLATLKETQDAVKREKIYKELKTKYGFMRPAHIHARAKRFAVKLYLADCVHFLADEGLLENLPNPFYPMTGKMYLDKNVDTFELRHFNGEEQVSTTRGWQSLVVWATEIFKTKKTVFSESTVKKERNANEMESTVLRERKSKKETTNKKNRFKNKRLAKRQ